MASTSWPKAVLFDLDGTLIDSVPDIRESLNQALEDLGEPEFSMEAVVGMIGGGVPKLIERAFTALGRDADAPTQAAYVERFLDLYGPRATRLTRLFSGAAETTRLLKEGGMPIGVVTNKPGAETQDILAHFGLAALMDIVVGGDAGPAKKPAPGLLLLACEKLGLAPAEVVFVGDSENDVEAARAAGMPVVAVRGGYTKLGADALGADLVIDALDALPSALETLGLRETAA